MKKRAKSVYQQRNLGTIKNRKKEKQQEKERKAMEKKLKESFNWLSEYDDVASTKDFVEQRAAIE